MMPVRRLELRTYWLRISCSTTWATPAKLLDFPPYFPVLVFLVFSLYPAHHSLEGVRRRKPSASWNFCLTHLSTSVNINHYERCLWSRKLALRSSRSKQIPKLQINTTLLIRSKHLSGRLMQRQNAAGFTLMKFFVVIAIIGILVIVTIPSTIPSYRIYTHWAHYTEVVQATASYKLVIEECYQTTKDLSECSAGKKWYSSHYSFR